MFGAFVLDYGMFWVARGQVQNAADAGALAGAAAIAFDPPIPGWIGRTAAATWRGTPLTSIVYGRLRQALNRSARTTPNRTAVISPRAMQRRKAVFG
jgi:hypothetical protein